MEEEKDILAEEETSDAVEQETVETVSEQVEEPTQEEHLEEEEPKEEPKEEKIETPKKEKPERDGIRIISRILNVLLWIVLFAWMALVIVDYIHVKNEEKPQFCWFNEHTTSYNDGTVTECTGLGYKVINYNRTSFKAIEFGPFWITDRTNEDKK